MKNLEDRTNGKCEFCFGVDKIKEKFCNKPEFCKFRGYDVFYVRDGEYHICNKRFYKKIRGD